MSAASETLVSIISHLGGPAVGSADIERELDFPAGKKLVEWLADQLPLDGRSDGNSGGQDRKLFHQSALEGVALDDEETQMLKRAKALAAADHEEFTSRKPPGYATPSGVRARMACIESEASFLESEATLLKHHLRQAKSAAQKTAQTIKSLKSALESADGEIKETKEQIEELSILADVSMSGATSEALQLLDKFKSEQDSTAAATKYDDDDIQSHLATLSRLSTLRSSIVSHHESQILRLQTDVSLMPTAEDIREEAGRLHEAFRQSSKGGGRAHVPLAQAAQEATYQDELARICDSLDSGTPVEAILGEDIVQPLETHPIEVDVKTELERAWNLDQAYVLQAKGRILDGTLTAFTSRLMPPLTVLDDTLSRTDMHIREVEAFVGALGEEIEDVVDNLRRAVEIGNLSSGKDIGDVKDEVLETELAELLKRLKDLRRMDAPPLVLLDRNDILTELRALAERASALEPKEEEWANQLPGILDNLGNTHNPLLSTIYAHSPVNTSPPFMPPPDLLSLENRARTKGEELAGVVRKLQKDLDTLQSGRTTRKLGAFVEKWGRGL